MTLTLLKIVLATTVFIVTLVGGLWLFLKQAHAYHLRDSIKVDLNFSLAESTASGVFFGVGLLHILPDAAHAFSEAGYIYPFPFLIAGVSFLLLLLLEHISTSLKHGSTHLLSGIVLLTATMLSIHSLLEGVVIGLANSFASMMVIFLAIIVHKSAASFALSVHLNHSQLNLISRYTAFSIFALMTPLGILGSDKFLLMTQYYPFLTPFFISLAAGTFLYIGTLHGLGRASLIKHCCNMKEFFCMLIGFTSMAIVAIWI